MTARIRSSPSFAPSRPGAKGKFADDKWLGVRSCHRRNDGHGVDTCESTVCRY